MKLSTKGRYAMVALADIALQPADALVSLGDISGRQDISLPYLEQLFVKLRRADLVTSVRGPGGGYRLARPAAEIREAEILAAVDETVGDEVLRPAVDAGLRRADTARVLARGLEAALASGQHQQALDSVLRGLDGLVLDNGPIFRARLGEESPRWVPEFVDDRVYDRLVLGLRRFIADVLNTPDHELRRQLTERMTLLAGRLRSDPALQQRVDNVRDELLDRPELRGWIEEFWTQVRADLRSAAASPTSGLHERTGRLVERVGRRLVDDAEMRGKLDDLIVRLAGTATERARPEIAEIISTTVDRWDADDTSRRIELQIGRDLQFIRINGTLVGALLGRVIHACGLAIAYISYRCRVMPQWLPPLCKRLRYKSVLSWQPAPLTRR